MTLNTDIKITIQDTGKLKNPYSKSGGTMSIDKSKITVTQFVFTIVCFIESSAVLSSFSVGISGKDSWFTMIMELPCLSYSCVCDFADNEKVS